MGFLRFLSDGCEQTARLIIYYTEKRLLKPQGINFLTPKFQFFFFSLLLLNNADAVRVNDESNSMLYRKKVIETS